MSNLIPAALRPRPAQPVLELTTPQGRVVQKFEQSVVHAAARAALVPLNETNAFTDAMAEEWLNSISGGKLRNILRDYIQHGHAKSLEP